MARRKKVSKTAVKSTRLVFHNDRSRLSINEPVLLRAVSIIQSTPVDEEIAEAILQGLRELDTSASERDADARVWRYAVRSSAIGEDSEETSAAGQNSTYLGVKDANGILRCVAKCWASLFSYQSVEYR